VIVGFPTPPEVTVDGDELLTTRQVAAYLQVPVPTLYDWRTGRRPCPPALRVGRHLRWPKAALDRWIADQRELSQHIHPVSGRRKS